MEFVSTLINGLSLGSIYALIALGYTMVYGIAKMLNFAHGDIIMVGAYFGARLSRLVEYAARRHAVRGRRLLRARVRGGKVRI